MSLAASDGRGGSGPLDFLLILGFADSHSCTFVSVTIRASTADRDSLDPKCSAEMAPVAVPASAILLVRHFSKSLPRHDKSEMGRMFFGFG